jgi:hypothetical protein
MEQDARNGPGRWPATRLYGNTAVGQHGNLAMNDYPLSVTHYFGGVQTVTDIL